MKSACPTEVNARALEQRPRSTKPTMPSLPRPLWMPVWVADHVADTARQTAAEYGAYMRLLCNYWWSGPPRDNNDTLARITGMTVAEWRKVRPAIEPRFQVAGGQWIHPQLDAELDAAYIAIQRSRNRTAAATRAASAKRRAEREASAIRHAVRDGARDDNGDTTRELPVTLSQLQIGGGLPKTPSLAKAEDGLSSADFGADLGIAEASFGGGR